MFLKEAIFKLEHVENAVVSISMKIRQTKWITCVCVCQNSFRILILIEILFIEVILKDQDR